MKKQITFMASLHRVVMDKEGESRVTFSIPKRDLDSVMVLAKQNEKLLAVGVVIFEDKNAGQGEDDIIEKFNIE